MVVRTSRSRIRSWLLDAIMEKRIVQTSRSRDLIQLLDGRTRFLFRHWKPLNSGYIVSKKHTLQTKSPPKTPDPPAATSPLKNAVRGVFFFNNGIEESRSNATPHWSRSRATPGWKITWEWLNQHSHQRLLIDPGVARLLVSVQTCCVHTLNTLVGDFWLEKCQKSPFSIQITT